MFDIATAENRGWLLFAVGSTADRRKATHASRSSPRPRMAASKQGCLSSERPGRAHTSRLGSRGLECGQRGSSLYRPCTAAAGRPSKTSIPHPTGREVNYLAPPPRNRSALRRQRAFVAGRGYRVRKASGASDVAVSAASIGEPITGFNLGDRDTALVHSHACVPVPKRRASPCQLEPASITIR